MINYAKLKVIQDSWDACELCTISQFARKHVHYRLEGNGPNCDLLFIGEGPGVVEDTKGEPFVGDSGKLLDDAVTEAVFASSNPSLLTPTWAFVNLVACRPTDKRGGANRQPSSEEITNCSPHLLELVKAFDPTLIVLVGRIAQENLDRVVAIPERSIPHPAYILRRGGRKSEDYKRYVDRLTEIFNLAWELGEAK